MYRNIQERISLLAPFLALDNDPYIVIADGKLLWMQDAYTTGDRYPFSQPHTGGFNYIRNSVKVVVDAYDGTTSLLHRRREGPAHRCLAGHLPDACSHH